MEAVILVGLQGAGKSSFYEQRFAQTHARVSLDVQKTREREQAWLDELLRDGRSFVVDNTNPTPAERQRYIGRAKAASYRAIGFYFDCPIEDCLRRNNLRQKPIPKVGIYATRKRMQPPTLDEGFDELYTVRVPRDNEFDCFPFQAQVSEVPRVSDEQPLHRGNP